MANNCRLKKQYTKCLLLKLSFSFYVSYAKIKVSKIIVVQICLVILNLHIVYHEFLLIDSVQLFIVEFSKAADMPANTRAPISTIPTTSKIVFPVWEVSCSTVKISAKAILPIKSSSLVGRILLPFPLRESVSKK